MALVLLAAGCERETKVEAAPPRPVRTVIAEKSELAQSVAFTGQIQAEKEVTLAFRIGGRILQRMVDTGDTVKPDQVVAKLDPQNELNALRSARAAVSAAEGRLAQDAAQFDRQKQLVSGIARASPRHLWASG
jgi:multidrug efflux pump subunit AcrA (membrane-fusion protein)